MYKRISFYFNQAVLLFLAFPLCGMQRILNESLPSTACPRDMNLQNIPKAFAAQLSANDRIIGFTGGPGVGKSTVLGVLKSVGVQTIPESFTTLFQEAKDKNQLEIFFLDFQKRRHDLIARQNLL